jgi:MFS family permease
MKLRTDVDALSARLSAAALNVCCINYFNLMPIILGSAAVERGLGSSKVGFLAAAFMAGLTLANLLGPYWLRRFSWKKIILLGNISAAVAFSAPVFFDSYPNWLACNFLAGIFTGLSYGVSVALMGDSREPERNFSFAWIGQTLVAATLIFVLPRVTTVLATFELSQIVVALMMMLSLLCVIWIPTCGSKSSPVATSNLPITVPLPRMALILALAVLLLNVAAEGSLWAFLEQIAGSKGISSRDASTAISASFFAAGVGSIIAALIGTRYGRMLPFLIAVISSILAAFMLWLSHSPTMYFAAVLLYAAAWNLGGPYRMGLAAKADVSGRFTTLIPAMQTLGAAIGPALAGLLIIDSNFTRVYVMCIMLWLITILLYVVADNRLNHHWSASQALHA